MKILFLGLFVIKNYSMERKPSPTFSSPSDYIKNLRINKLTYNRNQTLDEMIVSENKTLEEYEYDSKEQSEYKEFYAIIKEKKRERSQEKERLRNEMINSIEEKNSEIITALNKLKYIKSKYVNDNYINQKEDIQSIKDVKKLIDNIYLQDLKREERLNKKLDELRKDASIILTPCIRSVRIILALAQKDDSINEINPLLEDLESKIKKK
jgi:hypothetical protein